MLDQIGQLIAAGRYRDAMMCCSQLLDRLDNTSSVQSWREAFTAVFAGARGLATAGESQEALRLIEKIRQRFLEAPDWRTRGTAAGALLLAADIWVNLGQDVEALAAYDDALSLLPPSDEMTSRGLGINLLLRKAQLLSSMGRFEEAIVVLSAVIASVELATTATALLRTRGAGLAIIGKLDSYCALERFGEIPSLSDELVRVLTNTPEQPYEGISDTEIPSERDLAGALSGVINEDECWRVFDSPVQIPRDAATRHAMQLYGVSEPWAVPVEPGSELPTMVAAAIVRDIADGYALLAESRSQSDRKTLPLPRRAEFERLRLISDFGVDTWASGHGQPLRSPDGAAYVEPLIDEPKFSDESEWEFVEASFTVTVLKVMFVFEFADILARWASGRAVLNDKVFRALCADYLSTARRWRRQLLSHGAHDERAAIMLICQLIAQALFVASHNELQAAAAELPVDRLRELLHESGGYSWLRARDVPLPPWTA